MKNPIGTLKHALMVASLVASWMIVISSARTLSAQQQDESIAGTVVDSHGLVIPNAVVTRKIRQRGPQARYMLTTAGTL